MNPETVDPQLSVAGIGVLKAAVAVHVIGPALPEDAAVAMLDDQAAPCKGSRGPYSVVLLVGRYPVQPGVKAR